MPDYFEKTCPQCGQRLRFPTDIGGIVMVCPSCGERFHSDFKITAGKKSVPKGFLTEIFSLPSTILRHLRRYLR